VRDSFVTIERHSHSEQKTPAVNIPLEFSSSSSEHRRETWPRLCLRFRFSWENLVHAFHLLFCSLLPSPLFSSPFCFFFFSLQFSVYSASSVFLCLLAVVVIIFCFVDTDVKCQQRFRFDRIRAVIMSPSLRQTRPFNQTDSIGLEGCASTELHIRIRHTHEYGNTQV